MDTESSVGSGRSLHGKVRLVWSSTGLKHFDYNSLPPIAASLKLHQRKVESELSDHGTSGFHGAQLLVSSQVDELPVGK